MKGQSYHDYLKALGELNLHSFSFTLLRDHFIPELLGREQQTILYWGGKQLARKFRLSTLEELISFFQTAGWGHLQIVHQKKNEMELELTSKLIEERMKLSPDLSFQLEAGFIAQQIEQMKGFVTEAHEEIKKRANKVIITVKWDEKDTIQPVLP